MTLFIECLQRYRQKCLKAGAYQRTGTFWQH